MLQSSWASKRPSHLRNVVVTWAGFLLTVVTGLFLSPFVVRSLGTSGYGVWVLIGSLTGTLGIFDLGIRSAVIRFVAREHAKGDHDAASRITSTARTLFLMTGSLVILTALVLSLGIDRWFTVPAEHLREGRLVLMITAASLFASIQSGLYFGILSAMHRLDLVALADIVFELLRVALVLAVLGAGGGLLGLALIGFLLGLLRLRFAQYRAAQVYPELNLVFRRPDMDDIRMIVSVSAYSTLIYTSLTAIAQAKTLIIGATLPISMVAFYAIGTTLPSYANALNRPIAQTVHPRASRFDAVGDIDGLRNLVLNTGRYSALVLGPVVLTFVTRGHTFMSIWMGEQFRLLSGDVLAVLSVAMLFTAPRHVVQASFVGSGRHRSLAPWYIGEALVVLALSLVFIPRFGIVGAAYASVIPAAVMTCIVMPTLCHHFMDIPAAPMAMNLWVQPALAMVPFALVSFSVDRYWPVSTYLGFFSQVAVCMPVAALGAWLFAMTAEERARVRSMVVARLKRS